MTTIHLAHSPDSDDAFMFYGLATGGVDTEGIEYVHELQDIESLNHRALKGELEVTAVSIHGYTKIHDQYILLPHGASFGDGYGPMLVTAEPMSAEDLLGKRVAIPGELTTAALALRMWGGPYEEVVVPFDQIQDEIKKGNVVGGVIIHEGQLTYAKEGFHKVVDLGEWWKEKTGLPLPLGGNVIRKDLGEELILKVSRHLRASIDMALEDREKALDHAMQYARGLDRKDADTFVGMYVNHWTQSYGDEGRKAVRLLLTEAHKQGLLPEAIEPEWVAE